MNIFTKDDYRKIQAWLKANSIKDSDLTSVNDTIPEEDTLVLVQKINGILSNVKISIKDLLNSTLSKVIIDTIIANAVKVNNTLTVTASNVKIDNEKGTTLQDVLNYFEDNKLNRHTDDTFDGNLTVKKNITIEGNIKSYNDTITVEADLEATGEITDGQGNMLSDVNDASKGWKIEYQDPQQDEPTVRAKYVLKDYRGVPKGNVIKIYKDSAITNVYLGTVEDTCNPDTGEVTKHPIHNNNEALSIVYRLDTGKYSLVNIPIKMFATEAEFDKYRGLGVTENGQVFIKLASDVESSNYLHFNDSGELSADGIENRILRDLGTIINSVADDGTMWGQYKKEEGTKNSPINESSRWGYYKQAEADRSELLNTVSSKVNQLEQEQIQGGVYDVSTHNNNEVFESLSALLSNSNLNTLIPISVRHGGMSIRFIQGSLSNSDNKYVQYRLIDDEWSTNTKNWAISDESVYIENPEFVYVKTDNEGKILWAIKADGDIYYGAGIPQQIIDYIEEKIAELSLDEYEDIVTFLSDYLGGDATLKSIIDNIANTKVDKVPGKSLIDTEFAKGISQIENPEFTEVHIDAENKILYGIKKDGEFYFGSGVPSQIQKELDNKAEIDEVAEVAANKVDKEEGKSLINADYASSQSIIHNPEYLQVTMDSEDKVLEGIQQDGTKVIGGNFKVLGNMEVSGISYSIIENIEYLAAWVDAENKIIFGLKTDGKTYIGDADFLNNIKGNQEAIAKIKTTLATIGTKIDSIDIDALSSITATENPEFTEVTTDSEGNILSGRTPDGAAFENIGFSTPKVSIDGCTVKNIEDPEERKEITVDSENKIISYRDSKGVKHEEVGIDTREAIVKSLLAQNIAFKNDDDNNAFAKSLIYRSDSLKKYDLPDNGSINILNETFYLTKHEGYTDKNGIYPIQEYENNLENAEAKRICRVYYVKSTLRDNGDGTYSKIEGSVPLTLYVPKQIVVINDIPYVKDTLTEVSDGVYEVNEDSVAVTKITTLPDFQTWAINKNDEHQCKVAIDFGNYLSGEFFIGIKFQGASTLNRPKRNLRFTFYKKSDYNKKLKVKIGEFVRLSGFNLKAFWRDGTKLKEASLNRIMMAIWEKRPDINKTYPWIKDYGFYTGATGMIKSFPSMVSVGGEYYGFYIFGLKKDEKNYMLDGDNDASGIFASCDGMSWKTATARNFSDEMGVKGRELAYPDMGDDSLSVESAKALNVFLSFVANTLCTGSDGLSYGKGDLTFYVGKKDYTYDKVTTTDGSNGFVLIVNNDTKITAIYVTESLQTKNLLAQRTEERAYRGTDGNLYILSELTLIDGEYFVTETLQQENPIKAVILSGNVYNVDIDSEIFRFISSELTKIDNSYYHIHYYPDEHSISATYEPFSQSEAPKHMDILGFIDYFIGLQVFYMPDNVAHNLILYTKADKKVFYPFFYDMDLTFPNYNEITSNVLDAYGGNANTYIIWYSLIEEYADVIYNRYVELRKSILNIDYINEVFVNLRENIPQRWVDVEHSLWGATFEYNVILSNLMKRFDWLDKYFLNLIK